MGKVKVKNVKLRRNLAGTGVIVTMALPPAIYFLSGAAFIGLLAQITIVMLVVGLPLFILLWVRYNSTVRRYYREKAKRGK